MDGLPIVYKLVHRYLVFLSLLLFILLISIGNILTAEEPSVGDAATPVADEASPLAPIEATVPPPPAEAVIPLAPAEEAVPLPPSEATVQIPPAEAAVPLPPADSTSPLPPAEFTSPIPAVDFSAPLFTSEGTFLIQTPFVKKALAVGTEKCRQCHEAPSVQWENTIHAKWEPYFIKQAKARDVKKTDCETCHGPGSLHIEDPINRMNIISFGPESANTRGEQNAVCLNCHEKGGLYHWKGNIHGRNLRCTDCHHVMDNLSKRGLLNDTSERDICLRCHVQKKKDILRSPHLSHDEAKMTCSTCHAPHGSDTPGILSASSVNENCFQCHADKRGPYLFDHLPVQENCLLCHEPHSSMNRSLLKMRQPFLCLECHSNLPRVETDPAKTHYMPDAHDVLNPKNRYAYNKGCTNCHPMIHGSRHPSGARLQR